MRRRGLFILGFLLLAVGLIGAVGSQDGQKPSAVQEALPDEWVGKKICGYPRPEGVPVEVWENACEACTSVPVSPETSADGTLTSHSCDGGYEIRIKVVPGKSYAAGARREIMKGGGLGEEKPPERQERKVGEMPQVARTFTRYDASYPFMNEKGVIIGETTIGGRRELYNDEGLMDIMELERIALERASTAREAITIMGQMAEQYGYGDSGECLTVGDAREVWQFEIFGPGPADHGAVWAAKRIPPGEVGVSANRSRITTLTDDTNVTMYSKNVYAVAEANGWWKKGDPFIFNRMFGMSGAVTPNRREWRVLSILAPSLKLDPWAPEQPFSVKPDRKVTVRDVMAIHRDVYQGTEFDQTKGPLAGPFGTPNRWSMPQGYRPAPGYSPVERMIAVHQCSYVTVLQARANMPPWIGSLAWFAPDDAKTSVFTPLYAGNFKVPTAFEIGRRDRFDRNSFYWAAELHRQLGEPELERDDAGHPRQAGGDREQAVRRPAGDREDRPRDVQDRAGPRARVHQRLLEPRGAGELHEVVGAGRHARHRLPGRRVADDRREADDPGRLAREAGAVRHEAPGTAGEDREEDRTAGEEIVAV